MPACFPAIFSVDVLQLPRQLVCSAAHWIWQGLDMNTKRRKQTKTQRNHKEAEAKRFHDSRSGKATASREDVRAAREKDTGTTPPRDNVKLPAGE